MPIAVTCRCGKSFRAKDELAGKKVLCPTSKGVLTILLPAPPPTPAAPTRSAEDEAMAVLMSDEPVREEKPIRRTPVDPALPPLSANAPTESYGFANLPEIKPQSSSPPFSGGETKPVTKPKKPVKPRADLYSTSSSRSFFADANWGGALAGLLMMLFGAGLAALALAGNRVPIYGGIMAVLGFMAMVKSILGFSTDDD